MSSLCFSQNMLSHQNLKLTCDHSVRHALLWTPVLGPPFWKVFHMVLSHTSFSFPYPCLSRGKRTNFGIFLKNYAPLNLHLGQNLSSLNVCKKKLTRLSCLVCRRDRTSQEEAVFSNSLLSIMMASWETNIGWKMLHSMKWRNTHCSSLAAVMQLLSLYTINMR